MKKLLKDNLGCLILFIALTMFFFVIIQKSSTNPDDNASGRNVNIIEAKNETRVNKNASKDYLSTTGLREVPKESSQFYQKDNIIAEKNYTHYDMERNRSNDITGHINIKQPEMVSGSSMPVINFLMASDDESFGKAWQDLEERLDELEILNILSVYATTMNDEHKNRILSFLMNGNPDKISKSQLDQIEQIISEELAQRDSKLAADLFAVIRQVQVAEVTNDIDQ